jgi:hypothetical protein
MAPSKAHQVWIEQCEAAQTIRARYGLDDEFSYLVGEKLLNFAEAASRHPEFASDRSDPIFPWRDRRERRVSGSLTGRKGFYCCRQAASSRRADLVALTMVKSKAPNEEFL